MIAAQHLRLPDSDASRIVVDLVTEYRERMVDYASMRALDVWYDRIDLQRYEDRTGDPDLLTLKAVRGSLTNGIVSNPFLEQAFRTEMQRRLVAHVVDECCQQPEQRFAEVCCQALDLVGTDVVTRRAARGVHQRTGLLGAGGAHPRKRPPFAAHA